MGKITIFIIIIFFLLTGISFTQEKYAEKINWHSLKEGMEKAKVEKKPMLVDFGVVKGCPRCNFLIRNVYSNDEIIKKINSDFISIFINLSGELTPEEKALGEKYDYKNDCLLLFLDPEGNIMKDPTGTNLCFIDKIEPEVFIKHLDRVKNQILK